METGTSAKKQRRAILVACLCLLLFCAGSWALTFYGKRAEEADLLSLQDRAETLYQKKIYDEALEAYSELSKKSPENTELLARMAELYHLTGQEGSCVAYCERTLRKDPGNVEVALLEANSYDGQKKVASAIKVLTRLKKRGPLSEEDTQRVDTLLRSLKGEYDLAYYTFSFVGPWYTLPDGTEGATVLEEGIFSAFSAKGKSLFSGPFSYLGQSSEEELFPAKEGDTWVYVDLSGERREVPEGPYTFLGPFQNGAAPAVRGGQAGYLKRDMTEARFGFQDACPFVGDRALAKKDNTWFFLDTQFQELAACPFTDVKKDVYGAAVKYGLILGALPGPEPRFALFSENGTQIGAFSAEDLRLPESSDGPLAFCQGGLWGFVSREGEVLIEPQFEDARSFSKGLAPVRTDGKWGYIEETGAFIVPPTFEDAGAFSKEGTAFVKNHAGYCLLSLRRYQ